MTKKIIAMLALSGTIMASALNAQQIVKITTFADAARLALKNNADIANSALDIKGKQQQFREALSGGLPQIKASGNVNDYLTIPTTVYPASALGGPPGAMYAIQIGTTYLANGALSARQMLFDASFFTGLGLAKSSTELSRLSLRKTREDVIMELAGAYYGSLLNRKQAAYLMKQLDSYTSLLHVAEIQLQAGVAKKSDLNRLQVNKTNIETELDYVKNIAQEQLSSLEVLIGLNGQQQAIILDSITDTPIFGDENESYDVRNRADWQILQKQEEVNLLEIRQKQAGYLPVLSASAQAEKDYYGDDFKPLNGPWYNASSIGLTLDFPLFDGQKRMAQIARGRIELDKVHNREARLLSEASFEIQDANNKLGYSNSRVQSQKKNQELALEVYRETSAQYNGGTASLSDLLNAEASLLESQRQYLGALADKILAEFSVQKAKGVLLQKLTIG